jgi:extracellular elastinolytic metalloproteinase
MAKQIDTRDFSYVRPIDVHAEAARISADILPGTHDVRVFRVNSFTGGAAHLLSANAPATFGAAPGQRPSDPVLINVAMRQIQNVASALGFQAGERAEFVPDPGVKDTSSGDRVVNAYQQYHGVPVFQMQRAVLLDRNGVVQSVTGSSVGITPQVNTAPAVTVEAAVKTATEYVAQPDEDTDGWTGEKIQRAGFDVSKFEPTVLGRIEIPCQPAVLDKGPFAEPIPAYLVVFYQGPTTRLGWHVLLATPDWKEQYVLVVAADEQGAKSKEILYCQKTSHDMRNARGRVWEHNPGTDGERKLVSFPRLIADYPVDPEEVALPDPEFPRPWVDEGNNSTIGNNTIGVSGRTRNPVLGSVQGDTLMFDIASDQGDDQKIVNIFYFCNVMHDFYYRLGFDERYNFQKVNFLRIGKGGDPVLALAHPQAVEGTANMATRADGVQAVMNMGLVTGVNRHTAFDSDVVFHEFTHGVSNRLVGGLLDGRALQQPQSVGMGEGWSDYFALTFQNALELRNNPAAPEQTVIGNWVTNRPQGIRLHPYDDQYPATFGNVGSPPYDEDEHAIGEIWCATLMNMNRDFGKVLGGTPQSRIRGHQIAWQVVVDALKITPANPSMLDARDAILHALDGMSRSGRLTQPIIQNLRRAAWGAFARFGMGPNAQCVGASLEGIVEDTSPPADV